MKVYKINCPSCKAELDVEKGQEKVKCKYCNSNIHVDDETKKVEITKTINRNNKDETKVKEIESKEKLKLKQMELEEKRKENVAKFIVIGIVTVSIVFATVGLITFIWENIEEYKEEEKYEKEQEEREKNYRKIPISMKDAKGEDYKIIVKQFNDAGFTNVEILERKDLIVNLRVGEVEKITINGDEEFMKGQEIRKDSKIVIYYHQLKKEENAN